MNHLQLNRQNFTERGPDCTAVEISTQELIYLSKETPRFCCMDLAVQSIKGSPLEKELQHEEISVGVHPNSCCQRKNSLPRSMVCGLPPQHYAGDILYYRMTE